MPLCMTAYILWRAVSKQIARKRIKDQEQSIIDMGTDILETKESTLNASVLGYSTKQVRGLDLSMFDFGTISAATNGFRRENKLGEGGFGPVYKGKLPGGQEIAVKRLSRSSGQGSEEFKNEVGLISKLQHRNLVRLLGCCIDGEEKLLVYEFMPNNSLDAFIFDPTKRSLLDWARRFNIIEGIARGILYLHRDSRLKIIHRDLKASNILLDEQLNSKISDFGMARIFGGDQILAKTNRIVGTYFGVLLLEIVNGRRNTSFYHEEQFMNLLGFAWKLWNEDKIVELIDPALGDSFSHSEVIKCIGVGLLCVQAIPIDRPTMSFVVSLLNNDATNLPTPKKPGFIGTRGPLEYSSSQEDHETFSTNDVTISELACR